MSGLFAPFDVRGVQLRNRIVVSPMMQYAGVDGFPTDWHLMNLGRLAEGGASLVFHEGAAVERRGRCHTSDLGMWSDDFIEPSRRLASVVRENGAIPGIQLAHAGRKARSKPPWTGRGLLERTDNIPDWDEWEPIGPSPVSLLEGTAPPREMTISDIHEVIASFAAAARRANQAGYDVLEIHAAHGYLIHEFLSPLVNHRKDRYGGDFAGRTRMVRELVEATRAEWPQDKPLFVRLSCIDNAGWTIEDTVQLSRGLSRQGVDLIDCSSGGLSGSPLKTGERPKYGYQVDHAEQVRRGAGCATMAVGLIVHAEHADDIIASGKADLVALARELMHNPNWPVDAALKLDIDDPYSLLSPRSAYWLSQRRRAIPELTPSTLAPAPPGSTSDVRPTR